MRRGLIRPKGRAVRRAQTAIFSFSIKKMLIAATVSLALVYVILIALIMNYATLAASYAESIREEEAIIARIEQAYFLKLEHIAETDYRARGYEKPREEAFVTGVRPTALR